MSKEKPVLPTSVNCLNCGQDLSEEEMQNLCVKCLLNLDFKIEEADQEKVRDHLNRILDEF
ncbi:MAG: hypothetical protein ACTSRB_14670, partial [Candidatus Helarchaeota archaeon]